MLAVGAVNLLYTCKIMYCETSSLQQVNNIKKLAAEHSLFGKIHRLFHELVSENPTKFDIFCDQALLYGFLLGIYRPIIGS